MSRVHGGAAGLVDGRGGEVSGHHGRGVGEAEENQGRGHQSSAAHAGQADDDADQEAHGHDGQRRQGEELGHGAKV